MLKQMGTLVLLSSISFMNWADFHKDLDKKIQAMETNVSKYQKNKHLNQKARQRFYFTNKVFRLTELPDEDAFEEIHSLKLEGKLSSVVRKVLKNHNSTRISFLDDVATADVVLNVKNEAIHEILRQLAEQAGCQVSISRIGPGFHVEFWKTKIINFTLSLASLTHNYASSFVDGKPLDSSGDGYSSDESEGSDSMTLKSSRVIPSFWKSIKSELLAIMDSYGEKVQDVSQPITNDGSDVTVDVSQSSNFLSVNAHSNSLLVKGNYQQLLAVSRYLDSMVESHAKQVQLNVKVLEVTMRQDTETGIDWNAISKKINEIGSNYTSVPYNVGANFITISSNDPTKNYNVIFKTLQGHGRVKLVQQPFQVTMNNQPAFFRVGDTREYVKGSNTTITDAGLATATFTLGTVNEGLTMQVLPSVSDEDHITLNISTKIVNLNQLRTIGQGNGGQRLEAADTSESMTSQTVRMENGSTLLLGGMTSESYRKENDGLPSVSKIPILGWFTGRKRKLAERKEVIFLIQASVLHPDLSMKTM